MDVFHTPPHRVLGHMLTLDDEESAHCARVLRKLPGEEIVVADGAGTAYRAVIERCEARSVSCRILEILPGFGEPATEVHLAVALLKNASRFDVLVEKCTELGMRSLQPIITERTIPRHARADRWRKIALAAMKQSARCLVPEIREPASLASVLASAAEPVRLLAHERAEGALPAPAVAGAGGTLVLIGPEGGFSAAEAEAAGAAGFRAVRLAPRRLRTETAAIAAVTLLLAGGTAPPAA